MSHSNQLRQKPAEILINYMQVARLLEEPTKANFSILTESVATQIWTVETSKKSYCLKRALPKLNVKAELYAPIERSNKQIILIPDNIVEMKMSGVGAFGNSAVTAG